MALIKKSEFEQKNRKVRRKKQKKAINKSVLDIIPIKKFTEEGYTLYRDDIYSETFKINTVALHDISQHEKNNYMAQFAHILRVYSDSIKIISSNFNTDTNKQIDYWQEQLNIAEAEGSEKRVDRIFEQIIVLKLIAKSQINKEHYITIYGKNIEELEMKVRTLLQTVGEIVYPAPLTKEQKIEIFNDFSNPRVFD